MSVLPEQRDARLAVAQHFNSPALNIQRFTTGNHHYVYDVVLQNEQRLVARLTIPSERDTMASAKYWNTFLRPHGLPLPKILGHDLKARFPYLLLERFTGRDLGFYFEKISLQRLETLAKQIAQFQHTIAKVVEPSSGCGFAPAADSTPFQNWPAVLSAHIERSRQRLIKSRVAPVGLCDLVEQKVLSLPLLHEQSGTAFLHDLTSKNVIVNEIGELTGIVDVDDLCFGDPTFHLALTAVALAPFDHSEHYIQSLCNVYSGYRKERLCIYKCLFYLGFLSEIGLSFNGNTVDASTERIAYLQQALQQNLKVPLS